MWGIFFGEFQCLPVDECPAASCDSCVLTRGSESTSFYSAILVQGPCDPYSCVLKQMFFTCVLGTVVSLTEQKEA